MAVQFGVVSTVSGVSSMVVNSFSTTENAEIAEARDAQGKVTDMKAYSVSRTVSVKGLLEEGFALKAGDLFAMNNQNYIIESVSRNETNNGYVEVELTAKLSDSATASGYSEE